MRISIVLALLLCNYCLSSQNLTSSLVACYPMNGNGHEPVNLLTGTLSAVSPTVDRFNSAGSALAFSGSSSSYVQLPNSTLLKPTSYVSYAGWFRANSMANHMLVFAFNGCGSYFEGYCFSFVYNGFTMRPLVVKADGSCQSSGQALLYGSSTLTTQTWYHMGFTVGNDSMKIFVNGVQDAAMAINMAFTYTNTGVILGGSNVSFFNYPFNGSMDNGRFYNRKLSNQEFAALYLNDPQCVEPMTTTTASFNAPDTVCINQPVLPLNTSSGSVTSNYWSICSSTAAVTPVVSSLALTASSGPVYLELNQDNGDYYGHVTGNLGGNLMRLYYGNSMSNTPTLTNLGTFSGALASVADIHIQKEGTNWYGVVVGNTYVKRLQFGTSLANTPTVTNLGNIGNLSYPHSMHVFNSGGNYYALVTNYQSHSLTRLNFGNSLANTPTGFNFSSVLSSTVFNNPAQFEVVAHNGNWHVFVMNDGSSPFITRLDFGNSLVNVPTATVLGNPGNMLNGPRGMSLWKECGGALKGLLANRNSNQLLSVSMPSGPTGPVSLSSSGISGSFSFPNSVMTSRVGDTSVVFVVNVTNNSLVMLKYPTCTTLPSSTLQNLPPVTFTASGNYTVSLSTNENQAGGSKHCKQITVIQNFAVTATVSPAVACTGQSRTLSASGASSYTWYPGNLSGSQVTVSPLMGNVVYTVVGAIGSCTAQQVFTLQTLPAPTVTAVSSHTSICQGSSATLTAGGAMTFTWQPGGTLGPVLVVTPVTTTSYTVSGTNSLGCVSSTTAGVVVNAVPVVTVSPAAYTICQGSSVLLTAGGASALAWNPGNLSGPSVNVSPSVTTVYTVTGSGSGCQSAAYAQVSVTGWGLSASASSNTVCAGGSVTLNISGAIPGGPVTFTWLPGGSNAVPLVVTPAATTIYTLTGTHSTCNLNRTVNVTVLPGPALGAVALPSVICQGGSSTLTANGAQGYTWQPGNVTSQSVSVSPPATTIYTVTGNNAQGCTSSFTRQVTVNPLPTLAIVPGNTTMCAGTITLTASGASSYTWLPGNSTGQQLVVNLSSSANFTVNGTLSNCPGSATSTVSVLSPPAVVIASSPTNICAGGAVSFTASGANSYTWIPGGFVGPVLTASPVTSTAYQVTGTAANGCTSVAQVVAIVFPPPVIGTTVSSGNICSGGSFTITASGATSYTWLPGGVVSSSLVVTNAQAGLSSYTVTGSNAFCTTSITRTVLVNATPVLTAVAQPSVICHGQISVLTASGASSYTWFVPSAFAGNNVTVTPFANITYTVTGASNGCPSTSLVPVTVNPLPAPGITASTNNVCSGHTVQLTASGASSYTWQPGNNNSSVVNVTPLSTTVYTLFGSTPAGCVAWTTFTVFVTPSPTIIPAASSTVVCAGQTVTLSASGAGSTYTFNPVGLVGNFVQVTPTVSTLYAITGGTGACSSTTVIVVLVNPSPPLNVFANPAVVCAGQPAILQAGGPPGVTWQPGGLTGNQVTVTPLATTIYTATRSNPVGCSRSQTLQVTVKPLPLINVSGGANGVCPGQQVTLTASGANSYTWRPGGSVFPTVVVTPTATIVYTVSGSAAGCTSSAVYVLAVSSASPPSISVSQSVICSGAPVVLSSGGAVSYTWLPGNLSGQSVTVTPAATTVYTLIAQSAQGCIGRSSASVLVQQGAFISVSHPTSVCAGSAATIALSGAQNFSLNGNPSGGTALVLSPTISATYTVLGEGPGNCSDTAYFSIDVIQPPVIQVSQTSTILCSGNSATLSATGSGAVTWLPLNIAGSNVVVQPKETTTYTAQSGNGSCTYSAVVTLSVIDCPDVRFGVTNAAGPVFLSGGNKYTVGYTVTVVNQSSLALTEVTLHDDLVATFPYPCTYTIQGLPRLLSHNSGLQVNTRFNGANEVSLVVPSTSTLLAEKVDTIALTVLIEPRAFSGTARNWVVGSARTLWNEMVADSSNSGFRWDPDKDGDPTNNNDPTIVELKPITLFVPEAFSPDGDGRYDELIVKGTQGRSVSFTVFNRWGSKVYESTGPEVKWDGYANSGVLMGKGKLPPATYYYVLQFTDGERETIRGYVVISY